MASTSSSTQFKCACNAKSFQQNNKIFVCSGKTYRLVVVVQSFRRATNMRANCVVHMACRTPSNADWCTRASGGENCTTYGSRIQGKTGAVGRMNLDTIQLHMATQLYDFAYNWLKSLQNLLELIARDGDFKCKKLVR